MRREEPGAAVRRALVLLPVVLLVLAGLTVLAFVLSPRWDAAAKLSIPLVLLGVLIIAPGWVRGAEGSRAGVWVRVLARSSERLHLTIGSFWASPPGTVTDTL